MSLKTTNILSDQMVPVCGSDDHKSKDTDKISQLEMMQKLMQLLEALQEIERMLSGSTVDDLSRIADQGKMMAELSESEKAATEKAVADFLQKLDEQEKASFWQKFFGVLAGVLIIAISVATAIFSCGSATALSAGMIAGAICLITASTIVGTIMIANAVSPGCVNDLIYKICGNDPKAALALKIFLVALMATLGAIGGGPAGAIMMGAMMWGEINPTEECFDIARMNSENVDFKTAKDENAKDENDQWAMFAINLVMMVVAIAASFGLNAGSSAGKTASEVSKIANSASKASKAAESAEEEGIEMEELGESIGKMASEASSISDTVEETVGASANLTKEASVIAKFAKWIKTNMALIQRLIQTFQALTSATSSGLSIYQGALTMQRGDITERMAILEAEGVLHEQANTYVTELNRQVSGLMKNEQKAYQENSQHFINKIFIDQVNFATMLAQIA